VTPATVCGLPVVALVKLPEVDGYLPHRHVVVCRVSPEDHGEPGPYVLWMAAWDASYQGGQWVVTGSGRYDLAWSRALDLMIERGKGMS
jgi:hypothetical protein